jgi:hypothetical protein
MANTTTPSQIRRTAAQIELDTAYTKEQASNVIGSLRDLKPMVQEMQGHTASANALLYLILDCVNKQRITFLAETGNVPSVVKLFRNELYTAAKQIDEDANKESTTTILLVLTFSKKARYVKRYEAVIKKFDETRKDANEFLAWIEENGGIDGVLNYSKSKPSEGNDSKGKSANDPHYQAVTDELVAGRSEPIAKIKTSKVTGEYALVLAQRTGEGEYALIGSVDNLVDDAAPEVERFKQMIVSRKKAAKKAADAAAEKSGKKQA